MEHSWKTATGLAWAVPVRADLLGARLAARYELRPIINTLRLCQRFGKGVNAHINRLPNEIIDTIEKHLFPGIEEELEEEWRQKYSCVVDECVPTDHCDPDEAEDIWVDGCISPDLDEDMDDASNDEKLEAVNCKCACGATDPSGCDVVNDVLTQQDEYYEMHSDNISSWTTKVCKSKKTCRGEGNFVKFENLLRNEFGLETRFVTIGPGAEDYCCTSNTMAPAFAYLTLPSKSFVANNSHTCIDCETTSPLSAAMVIPDEMMRPLRDEERRRFHCAMRRLRLEPFVHTLQTIGTGRDIEEIEDDNKHRPGMCSRHHKNKLVLEAREKSQALVNTEWPKRLLLNVLMEDAGLCSH